MLRLAIAVFAAWVLALLIAPSQAFEVVGRADVVDGDTLWVDGLKIRIQGIDAPESTQFCTDSRGRDWKCGEVGARYLAELTENANIRCIGSERDRYKRLLAECYVGPLNVGAAMVEKGLAVAYVDYSDQYLPQQRHARDANFGIWSGSFQQPTLFRSMRWYGANSTQTAPGKCPIKGNISSNGRIYHTPYSDSYARTRIDESKGERWFCSEDEALAAGWRPAMDN